MIKAVLDTNIYISAYFWKGKQDQIIQSAIDKRFTLLISREILNEILNKLREKFCVEEDKIVRQAKFWGSLAIFVEIQEIPPIVEADPDDNKIVATAITGGAEYIVTGDKHLLDLKEVRGIKIVNSTEFLKKMKQTST